MRIEKVGGDRKGVTVICLRHLCFSEEKKLRFREGEVVLYRWKIRSKTANVAEVEREKYEGGVKTHRVDTRTAVRQGDINGPLPRRGLRGWCRSRLT